jgi:hypothetical protein
MNSAIIFIHSLISGLTMNVILMILPRASMPLKSDLIPRCDGPNDEFYLGWEALELDLDSRSPRVLTLHLAARRDCHK